MTMTVQQCAQELDVVSHTIRKWIWSGDLPATKAPKGREQWTYVVRPEDWRRFVAARAEGRVPDWRPTQPSQHYAYFSPDDSDDRAVMQATLMRKALKGDTAAREALRQSPFHLTYWMAVDGAQ